MFIDSTMNPRDALQRSAMFLGIKSDLTLFRSSGARNFM